MLSGTHPWWPNCYQKYNRSHTDLTTDQATSQTDQLDQVTISFGEEARQWIHLINVKPEITQKEMAGKHYKDEKESCAGACWQQSERPVEYSCCVQRIQPPYAKWTKIVTASAAVPPVSEKSTEPRGFEQSFLVFYWIVFFAPVML